MGSSKKHKEKDKDRDRERRKGERPENTVIETKSVRRTETEKEEETMSDIARSELMDRMKRRRELRRRNQREKSMMTSMSTP